MKQTLYFNGNIITVYEKQPTVEAVLVEDGLIKAVGNYEDIKQQANENVIMFDLKGHTLIPGFIDGHSHITFADICPRFDAPPVGDIDCVDKLVESAKDFLERNPIEGENWMMGMGYDNSAFPGHKHPTVADMDRITTEVPVVMMHASGHVAVCNSKLFEVLGITKDTPNPEGGIFQKDPVTGELTGLVEETALTKEIFERMPKPDFKFLTEGVLRSQKLYLKNGVTTAQDGSCDPQAMQLWQHLSMQGMLHIDICAYVKIDTPARDFMLGKESPVEKYVNGVKFAGMKLFLDGSPQAKTAWLTKPYYIVPDGENEDYCGYPVYPDDNKVCDFAKMCLKNKWQLITHCNGDAAIDQLINQYARAQKETGIYDDLRPVVIHCQTVREDQLDRMKEIGMMPSFFHDHVLFWGDWHLDSVFGPERGSRISPLATTVERNMPFTLHQDTPVAPPDMMLTIHNAVNRKTASGRDIGPEYAISPLEALKGVTIHGAYEYFEEDKKGSIEVGKLADFVILEKNLLEVPRETIKDIRVLNTIKQDEVVYTLE